MSNRRFDPLAFEAALTSNAMKVPKLARAVGLSERYVYACSSGMVPGPGARQKLATALGVSADVLWPCDRELGRHV